MTTECLTPPQEPAKSTTEIKSAASIVFYTTGTLNNTLNVTVLFRTLVNEAETEVSIVALSTGWDIYPGAHPAVVLER